MNILEDYREIVAAIADEYKIGDTNVNVVANVLTPEEAIGSPSRDDYPILEGLERIIEAEVFATKGQVFTDNPSDFKGSFKEVLEMTLDTNKHRAIFLAATNAILSHLKIIKGSIHCRGDIPEKCASCFADSILKTKKQKVGLIGYNPALAEGIIKASKPENVMITDLNENTIGTEKFGVTILNGKEHTRDLIKNSDIILVTGTTLVNDSFDEIFVLSKVFRKRLIVFGISGAGVCELMNLERWCYETGHC